MKFAAKKGFSLIELMVVVAIIGILSVVGVPKYQAFKAKAVTSEATSALAQIYTVQQAYYMDKDAYAVMTNALFTATDATNLLGFVVPAKSKYTFDSASATPDVFVATATYKTPAQKLASCSTNKSDVRTMDQNKTLAVTTDGLAGCN
jgi:prepilin-type N-terminal cleavage/methylation domain-containing protein